MRRRLNRFLGCKAPLSGHRNPNAKVRLVHVDEVAERAELIRQQPERAQAITISAVVEAENIFDQYCGGSDVGDVRYGVSHDLSFWVVRPPESWKADAKLPIYIKAPRNLNSKCPAKVFITSLVGDVRYCLHKCTHNNRQHNLHPP